MAAQTRLERIEGGFCIDAALVAELLGVRASDVQELMRAKEITSLSERGEGEHAGQYRLTFQYKGRRGRLNVDEDGLVIRRSMISVNGAGAERLQPGAAGIRRRPR
ncbi:MAG: DUF6522 family protein [Caulobacteraceae bacterium]